MEKLETTEKGKNMTSDIEFRSFFSPSLSLFVFSQFPPRMDHGDGDGDAAAEQLILRWNSGKFLFNGGDRSDAERYLQAVDVLLRSSPATSTIQIAMARLEDEYRNILATRINELEVETLAADLSSASLSSVDFSLENLEAEEEEDGDEEEVREGETISRSMNSNRIGNSVREIDLLPIDAIDDLKSIADRMIAAGYSKECFQAHRSARKSAVDRTLYQLGAESISIGDVQRLDWEILEGKIRRWIRAAQVSIRVIFPSERRLWEMIFGSDGEDQFLDTIKGAAVRLLTFPEAVSISRRTPEKLFKVLDLHDAISELLPDLGLLFRSADSTRSQASGIVRRLADAARGIVSEFESAVRRDPSGAPVRGGGIHGLTSYVMNYISVITDYKETLQALITSPPSDFQSDGRDPLSAHLAFIISLLEENLESKAGIYKEEALQHFFLMNNVHYIVQKVRGNEELREMIGDDPLRRMTWKYQKSATCYRRSSLAGVLGFLKEEGLQAGGSFSSNVSKSAVRERFRGFNAAFEEVRREQSQWNAPDWRLKEELRISVSEVLVPAYRGFVGRFGHYVEKGRHPEAYLKYSVEELEAALAEFFEGGSGSVHHRRRSQS